MCCRDCGHEMHVYLQPRMGKPPVTLAECKNAACDLYDVTLSADRWQDISAAELETYRDMVRKLRTSAA